jgi:hypothetical protein
LNRDRKFFQTIRGSGSTWRNRSFAECGMSLLSEPIYPLATGLSGVMHCFFNPFLENS